MKLLYNTEIEIKLGCCFEGSGNADWKMGLISSANKPSVLENVMQTSEVTFNNASSELKWELHIAGEAGLPALPQHFLAFVALIVCGFNYLYLTLDLNTFLSQITHWEKL